MTLIQVHVVKLKDEISTSDSGKGRCIGFTEREPSLWISESGACAWVQRLQTPSGYRILNFVNYWYKAKS